MNYTYVRARATSTEQVKYAYIPFNGTEYFIPIVCVSTEGIKWVILNDGEPEVLLKTTLRFNSSEVLEYNHKEEKKLLQEVGTSKYRIN